MKKESKFKKKTYFPPALTKITENEAKQFVADRTNCSDEAASDVLDSLRREHSNQQKDRAKKAERKAS